MAKRLAIVADEPPLDDAQCLEDVADYEDRAFVSANISPAVERPILATITADKFCAVEIGPIDYLVRPVIVRGSWTTFYGRPKVGKTTFVAHAVAALLDRSRPFLDGVQGIDGPVLWLDLEQPIRISQRRFSEAGLNDAVHIYRGDPPSLAQLLATIDALRVELLVVDSVTRWLMLANENDNSEVNAKIAPILTALQQRDVTVISIDHANKSEGTSTPGTSLRGASDKLAKVDIACEVKAEGPLADGRRRLAIVSREEIVSDVIVRLENGRYVLEGSARAVAFFEHREKIEKGIRFGHSQKSTLAEYLKVTTKTLEGWIAPLINEGIVIAAKGATRGAPVTYSMRSSQNFSETSDNQRSML